MALVRTLIASSVRSSIVNRFPKLLSARGLPGSISSDFSSIATAAERSPPRLSKSARRRCVAASRGASSITRRAASIASGRRLAAVRISCSSRCASGSRGSRAASARASRSASSPHPLRQALAASARLSSAILAASSPRRFYRVGRTEGSGEFGKRQAHAPRRQNVNEKIHVDRGGACREQRLIVDLLLPYRRNQQQDDVQNRSDGQENLAVRPNPAHRSRRRGNASAKRID